MGEEFLQLQNLIKADKAEIRFKKSLKDTFGVWLYWVCKTKPSVFNLYGKIFILYWIISSEWLWIPLSIFLAVKINLWFLLLILLPLITTRALEPIGQGFMIHDAQNNENLFDDLWQNKKVGIMSVKKRESAIHKDGIPEIIIDSYYQDWRREIIRNKF